MTCQGWWGVALLAYPIYVFCLTHALSPFCHVPLICSAIIFHFHVTVATPLSYFLYHFCLSSLPSLPIFFICHLIVNLLPLPTLPIFMLPNVCPFILSFLLMFIPFSHSSCILRTAVGFPCFSVPWSCCWDSQGMKVFLYMHTYTSLHWWHSWSTEIKSWHVHIHTHTPPSIELCFALTKCRAGFLGIKLQNLAEKYTVNK